MFESFKQWLQKRKYKYLGYITLEATYESILFRRVRKEDQHVHFWENGYGERKITGDTHAMKFPHFVAWLNGKEVPQVTARLEQLNNEH